MKGGRRRVNATLQKISQDILNKSIQAVNETPFIGIDESIGERLQDGRPYLKPAVDDLVRQRMKRAAELGREVRQKPDNESV